MSLPDRAVSYAVVLRTPGAPRTFTAATLARLSYGTLSLSLLLTVQAATGSFAVAGADIGVFGVPGVLLPLKSRWIDRYGRRWVLAPLAVSYATALLAIAALGAWGTAAPAPYLAVSAVAGLLTPPIGGVERRLPANRRAPAGLPRPVLDLRCPGRRRPLAVGRSSRGTTVSATQSVSSHGGPMTTLDRRSLLKSSAAVTAGTLIAGTGTQALAARGALAAPGRPGQRLQAPDNGGYGPLFPVNDRTTGLPLLLLPQGFEYASFGHAAAYAEELNTARKLTLPTTGADGFPTPGRHDGMAAFATDAAGVVRLVRNHEQGYGVTEASSTTGAAYTGRDYDRSVIGNPALAYDPRAAGGTTTLTFDTRTLTLTSSFISLNGTSVNCAGGPTPWGSWLTCEETVNGKQNGFPENHGYVFEVPAAQDTPVAEPVPYTAMGRFAHEAVAIDPASGYVYETEDNGGTSGFYRFLPNNARDLSKGGTLQMLAINGRPQFVTNRGVSTLVGRPLSVSWVTIDDPDPDLIGRTSVYDQGRTAGAASFARLEGCWYDRGSIFFNATSGGDAGAGQVWEYRPKGRSGGQLVLLFESPSPYLLDSPDNITVSPRGGLVLCEDGGGDQYVRGLNARGEVFDFAENNIDGDNNEFAGACFSPAGDVMFVNVQTPGVSFAIRGPWRKGSI